MKGHRQVWKGKFGLGMREVLFFFSLEVGGDRDFWGSFSMNYINRMCVRLISRSAFC